MIKITGSQLQRAEEWCCENISIRTSPMDGTTSSSGPGWIIHWSNLDEWTVRLDDKSYELMLRLAV